MGTGRIAAYHLDALRAIPGVSVAAVCDVSRAAAEATAERYGAPAWYTDHGSLLRSVRPDVVHVTTPPAAHLAIALDALDAGAHVVVEKPAAPSLPEVELLVARARTARRSLVEDYNYLFNPPVRRLLALVDSGRAGRVVHIEVTLCLETDAASTVADYVPHLASLVHAFAGSHREVAIGRRDARNLQALVSGERATAAVCFSGDARPDTFLVRVHATRLRGTASVFDAGLFVEREHAGLSRPLVPLANGVGQGLGMARAAVGGLWGKVSGGPGSYAGLWELLRLTYAALATDGHPPVSLEGVLEVNRLVADLSAPVRA